jgi:hypothetical protein
MMDALLVEPNLTDPDAGVNFDVRAVDVCASVEAEDEPAALRLGAGRGPLRSAPR